MLDFSSFRNLYPVTRTLRFGLKPVGNTWQNMQDAIEKDKQVQEAYQQLKMYLDKLHQEVIDRGLNIFNPDLTEYSRCYYALVEERKKKRDADQKQLNALRTDLETESKQLREQLLTCIESSVTLMVAEYPHIKFKKRGTDNLYEVTVLEMLSERYPDSRQWVDKFSGFWTYFKGYNTNRANYYATDGKPTSCLTRVIDINLPLWLNNIAKLKALTDEHKTHLTTFARDVLEENLGGETEKQVLARLLQDNKPPYTQQSLLQYNEIVGIYNKTRNLARQQGFKDYPALVNLQNNIGFRIQDDDDAHIMQITDEHELRSVLIHVQSVATRWLEADNPVCQFLAQFGSRIPEEDESTLYLKKSTLQNMTYTMVTNKYAFTELLGTKKKSREQGEYYAITNDMSLQSIRSAIEHAELALHLKENKEKLFTMDTLFNHYADKYRQNRDVVQTKLGVFEQMLQQDSIDIEKYKSDIKEFADAILNIERLIKDFTYIAEEPNTKLIAAINEIESLHYYQYYNALRNYLTQIKEQAQRWKLNFENGEFLAGWSLSKVSDNQGAFIKKDNKYFLLIPLTKNSRGLLNREKIDTLSEELGDHQYEFFKYFFLSDPIKSLANYCFSGWRKALYQPSDEILNIKENKLYSKDKDSLSKIIQFYIDILKVDRDWSIFNFVFRPVEEYTTILEFGADVARQAYLLQKSFISNRFVDSWVENGDALLFEISSKDFKYAESSGRSKKDLNTLYFLSALNPENKNIVKLNGQAELFYRPKVVEYDSEKTYHPKKEGVKGQTAYRYSHDTLHFHCSITQYHNASVIQTKNHNQLVLNAISKTENLAVIGIDRGERHLLYYSIVNASGKLLAQGSLNTINGVDYHNLLLERRKQREDSRRNWEAVAGIKNLKNGYIGAVVHQITKLMKKHNAVVCMESLNAGFKHGRSYLEESVYNRIETALATKLTYLVEKTEQSVLQGLQLVPPVSKVSNIANGLQFGTLFFVSPSYTSQIDPVSGWRPVVRFGTTAKEVKSTLNKMHAIEYSPSLGFEFTYDQKDFAPSSPSKLWKLSSYVDRVVTEKTDRNHWISREINLTEEFKRWFTGNGISLQGNILESLKEKLSTLRLQDSSGMRLGLTSLVWLWNKLCQIRNSYTGTDQDFLHSPVYPYFDTRKALPGLPDNGDANGAYNIARKGLLLVRKLQQGDGIQVTLSEWDTWLSQKAGH